jgi:hypothetical protein
MPLTPILFYNSDETKLINMVSKSIAISNRKIKPAGKAF